jgi:hypothetical protein
MKSEDLGPSLLLALSTVAMLSGARSLYAIAQWGREQPEDVVRALGFTRGRTPGVATLHRVFKALDVDTFEARVGQWAQAVLDGRGEAIAIDGKALRGIHGEELPGVRLVAAYDVRTGLVLAQGGGEAHMAAPGRGRGGRAGRGESAGGAEHGAAGAAPGGTARTGGDR